MHVFQVTDPELKRKLIGNTFIELFEKEAENLGGIEFLLQGTLYPDVIESISHKGPSATIKSHHVSFLTLFPPLEKKGGPFVMEFTCLFNLRRTLEVSLKL